MNFFFYFTLFSKFNNVQIIMALKLATMNTFRFILFNLHYEMKTFQMEDELIKLIKKKINKLLEI